MSTARAAGALQQEGEVLFPPRIEPPSALRADTRDFGIFWERFYARREGRHWG